MPERSGSPVASTGTGTLTASTLSNTMTTGRQQADPDRKRGTKLTNTDTRDANVRDFSDLTRQRFELDNQIGKLAAAIVLDKMNQYQLDEIDLDDENETPSYAMLPDSAGVPTDTGRDDQDELLDEAVGWLPRMAIYNMRGRCGEPPKARREDLEKLLRGEAS